MRLLNFYQRLRNNMYNSKSLIISFFCGALAGVVGAAIATVFIFYTSTSPSHTQSQRKEHIQNVPWAWNVCEKLPKDTTHMQRRRYARKKWGNLLGKGISFLGTVGMLLDNSDEYGTHITMFVENKDYDTYTGRIVVNMKDVDEELRNMLLTINRGDYVQVSGVIDGKYKCDSSASLEGKGVYSIMLDTISKITEEQYEGLSVSGSTE